MHWYSGHETKGRNSQKPDPQLINREQIYTAINQVVSKGMIIHVSISFFEANELLFPIQKMEIS